MSVRESLKQDLKRAMKERNKASVSTIKSVLSALDNAEAVPAGKTDLHDGRGAAGLSKDVPRRELTDAETEEVIRVEAEELRTALGQYEDLGHAEKADEMRTALRLLSEYIDIEVP